MRRELPGQARRWAGQGTLHSIGMVLGKDQGISAAPNPGMKAWLLTPPHNLAVSTQSDPRLQLPCTRAHLEKEVAGPTGGWTKHHPSLNGDVWVWDHPHKQANGGCTRGVLIAPRLASHQDSNPPTCSFSGHPMKKTKVSLKQRPACSH